MAEQAYAYVTLIPVAKGFQSAIAKEMSGVGKVGANAGEEAGEGFNRAFASELDDVSVTSTSWGEKSGKGFGAGFGKAFAGVATLVGGALAAVGVGNFLRDSITAASDLNESLNAVSVSYGEATSGIVALGETAANRLGLSTNQFNAIATQFSGFASNIAGEGGDVVGFIDELTTRGADFASVFNLDVDEALALFQSGLAGETEPLRKFGLDLSAATVEAFAYANGIGEAGKPLTEAQKQQARYGALLEQTAKVQGDFTNTSDSLANAQRILNANMENVQATVGGPLLNAFASLTTALIPVVNELGPVLVGVMEQLSPVIADLAGQLPGLLTALFPLIPVLGQLAIIFVQLVAQLLPVFVNLFTALLPIITELVPVLASFISDALSVLVPVIIILAEALMPIIQEMLPVFLQLFEALAPVTVELVRALLPLIQMLLPVFIDLMLLLLPLLVGIAQIIGQVMVLAINLFAAAVRFLGDVIGEFAEFFMETWDGISLFFGDIINGLIAGFEAFVNGAIKGVNRVIDAINSLKFTVPAWIPGIGGQKFGFNLSRLAEITLPRVAMAKGGFVDTPTNALIGEAGPEVVMPLDRFERMMGLDGGNQRPINYYAAPNKSFDAEQELLLAMRRAKVMA